VTALGARLSGVTKQLWQEWQQTKYHWRDAKSREFEEKYLSELVASVEKTVGFIEELDKLITRIKRDCS
jgi:hypothetical protein